MPHCQKETKQPNASMETYYEPSLAASASCYNSGDHNGDDNNDNTSGESNGILLSLHGLLTHISE